MRNGASILIILIIVAVSWGQTFSLTKKYRKTSGAFNSLGLVYLPMHQQKYAAAYQFFCEKLLDGILRNPEFPKVRIMNIEPEQIARRDSVKIARKQYFKAITPNQANICVEDYCPDILLVIKRFQIKSKKQSASGTDRILYTFRASYYFWDNRNEAIVGYGSLEKQVEREKKDDITRDIQSASERFSIQIVDNMDFLEKS